MFYLLWFFLFFCCCRGGSRFVGSFTSWRTAPRWTWPAWPAGVRRGPTTPLSTSSTRPSSTATTTTPTRRLSSTDRISTRRSSSGRTVFFVGSLVLLDLFKAQKDLWFSFHHFMIFFNCFVFGPGVPSPIRSAASDWSLNLCWPIESRIFVWFSARSPVPGKKQHEIRPLIVSTNLDRFRAIRWPIRILYIDIFWLRIVDATLNSFPRLNLETGHPASWELENVAAVRIIVQLAASSDSIGLNWNVSAWTVFTLSVSSVATMDRTSECSLPRPFGLWMAVIRGKVMKACPLPTMKSTEA